MLRRLIQDRAAERAIAYIESTPDVSSLYNPIAGSTPLCMACEEGLQEVALALLYTGHSNPEYITDDGQTALLLACQSAIDYGDMNACIRTLIHIGTHLDFISPST